jgi:hypothetical protein
VNASIADPTPSIDILQEPASFASWTFLRRGRLLTCEIMTNGSGSCDVCVITHRNVALSVIEAYDTAASALYRHAELVSDLRKVGWVRLSEIRDGDIAAA